MLIIYVWFFGGLLLPVVFAYYSKKYNWFGFTDRWPIWVKAGGNTIFLCLILWGVFPKFWAQEFENIVANENRLASSARIVMTVVVIFAFSNLGIKNKWADRFDNMAKGKKFLIVLSFIGVFWVVTFGYFWFEN
jgi:hypothetical protein